MYVTGSDAWNSEKSDVGGQEWGAKARAKCGRVYPSRRGAATKAGAVLGSKTVISRMEAPNRLPIPGRRLSLAHDRPFPVPEHLFGAAVELFRPGSAHASGLPAADQAEPAAGAPARPRSGPAGEPASPPNS